jgi:hypothetical protein
MESWNNIKTHTADSARLIKYLELKVQTKFRLQLHFKRKHKYGDETWTPALYLLCDLGASRSFQPSSRCWRWCGRKTNMHASVRGETYRETRSLIIDFIAWRNALCSPSDPVWDDPFFALNCTSSVHVSVFFSCFGSFLEPSKAGSTSFLGFFSFF